MGQMVGAVLPEMKTPHVFSLDAWYAYNLAAL